MDGILIKFQSPDWWFTGIFFILLGLLIRFVLRKIPGILKKLFRNSNAKTLKKIKKTTLEPI